VLQLYLFDSGYSFVVLEEGGRQNKRGSDITIFFPKYSFLSLLISCLYLSYLTLNSCFVFVLRQLKNNQKQKNTTGTQNFKEFNNTAGWLFVLFFFNELIK
jgi:hypothetical protein